MQIGSFRKYSFLGQAGLWFLLSMVYLLEELEYSDGWTAILYTLCIIFLFQVVVYGHYFLLIPLLKEGKIGLYIFSLIPFLICVSIVGTYLNYYYPFEYEVAPYPIEDTMYYFFLYSVFAGVSSLYYFVENWFENFQRSAALQREKLQAELNFLKSQINPHFLFNTLNNIYSYAQTGNQKTAPMLERLSSILRFMVYDCSEAHVALVNEIQAIDDLLAIHKMKNTQQQNISFETTGVKRFHLIAPLILVNFVENACKHSNTISNLDGFLKIQLQVDAQDRCTFELSNSIKNSTPKKTDSYQGVGLQNIKKRLELEYQDQYQLEEGIVDGIYQLHLSLPLKRKA